MESQIPKSRFVPHRTLKSGWTYLAVDGADCVVGLKIVPVKVMQVLTPDGKPMLNPDGTPIFSIQSTNVTRILTKAEWDVVRQMAREGDAGD